MKFRELDTVKVTKDINGKVKKDMVGVIVYATEGYDIYEVEFLDIEGYTIDLQTINEENLELISNNE
ncbi:uncharacterized protein DUF4926 [Breznakia blatticola]|uniref:Uncharacterized protein DUF4926 n=1 Tax=Breznakia blatticola TaxID=1754012 RepID=A0A4R7ZEL7_9FIRM|nr:DUF4926 domain-containing protein [Breznakia blatticola]TDW14691.1 uncharacterized protein DUF4926 [Breznakia blatticola]